MSGRGAPGRRGARPWAVAGCALVLAGVPAACGADPYDGSPSGPAAPEATSTTVGEAEATVAGGGSQLEPTPESVEHAADWPLPGRDLANARAVPEADLTADDVDQIEVAWEAEVPGPGTIGNAATTPVVADGVVYLQDLWSNVRAYDLATGDLRWEQLYQQPTQGPNGATLGWGRVYAAKGTEEVAALDAETGEELWVTRLTDGPEGIDIQPQVFGGLVLVSTVPINLLEIYVGGARGVLHALDAETGEVVWTFDTVAGDDLWGDPELNSGGGAWYPPAVDPESGSVYWGVANPAPFPGLPDHPNGSSRPGPNLYTNSVVALDVATGELRWYQQAIEHDIFDRDLVHALVAEGEDGPVVVGTGKLARVIGHDPETGEVLWDTEVGFHQDDDLTELDGPTTVAPGTYGGVITPPATADGVVYVAVLNAPTELQPDEPAYFGAELGQMPGALAAVDATTGELLWEVEVDGDPLGAATVVGELVFTGTYQGTLFAFDRETGEQVWSMEAPAGLNGWPAVADGTLLWPIGFAQPAVLLALDLPG